LDVGVSTAQRRFRSERRFAAVGLFTYTGDTTAEGIFYSAQGLRPRREKGCRCHSSAGDAWGDEEVYRVARGRSPKGFGESVVV